MKKMYAFLTAGVLILAFWVVLPVWAGDKTSALLESSNGIYDSVNAWNNTQSEGISNALMGLPTPITVESINALDNADGARRLVIALDSIRAIIENGYLGKNRGYWDVLNDAGYSTLNEAYLDVPLRFQGQTKTNIQRNLADMDAAWLNAKSEFLDAAFISKVLNSLRNIADEYSSIVNGVVHE